MTVEPVESAASITGWQPRVMVFGRGGSAVQFTGLWRYAWALNMLAERGYPIDHHEELDLESLRIFRPKQKPDLILVPRMFGRWTMHEAAWTRALHAAGINVVADHDDDQVRFHPLTEHQRAAMRAGAWGDPDEYDRVQFTGAIATRAFLKECDGCTVSTAALGAVVRQYVRPHVPVVVVPNAINPDAYVSALSYGRRTVPPLTIGWAASPRAGTNFEATGMAAAWAAIARRYPDVTFVTIGHLPTWLDRYVGRGRVVSFPMQDSEAYPHALINIDIACCVLEPSDFNVCKSPQKAWEHVLTGAAVVCSPTVYADDQRLVESGGLLADGADEWEERLSRLIESEQERRDRVASLQRFVLEERSMEANLWRWPDAWRQIVSQARRGRGTSHKSDKRKKAHRR